MIEIRDVTKRYGEVTALDGVSMAVDEGAAVGLIGTNGAGKTTLFRLLVGHTTPDSGTVRVAGRSPTAGPALRERVGFVPEDASFDPRLTAREVLSLHAKLRGVPAEDCVERVGRVLATVGLTEAADRRVDGYSNGMTQRLAIGTALVRRPDVLLLDEPTAALDPQGVDAFNQVVDRVRERTSVTLVVTSHVLSDVERLCDRVVVMDGGVVKARGRVADVKAIAGDAVTVRLRPEAPAKCDELVSGLDDQTAVEGDDVRSVTRRGDTVVASCRRQDAFDVVAAAREIAELDGFEVEEPGLADAFDVAVDGRTDAAAGSDRQDADGDGDPSDLDAVADGGTADLPFERVLDDQPSHDGASVDADPGGATAAVDPPGATVDVDELTDQQPGTADRTSETDQPAGTADDTATREAVAMDEETATEPTLAASAPAAVGAFARREYRIATRSRWPVGLTILFAAFTAGVVQFGATGVTASTVPAVIASIAALSTYVVPLAALAFGYATVVGPRERGELDVLYALPVPRWSVVVGAFAGRAFALAGSVVVGYAAGAAVLFRVGGVSAVQAFLPTVAAAAIAGVAFLAIAVLVSSLAGEKAHALGGVLIVWAWFVLVHDVVALTAVVLFDLPASALAALIAANPADCLRVLGMSGVPTANGGAGALAATDLTIPIVLVALLAWIAVPMVGAARAVTPK